ncbi:MAG: VTT domain-containing protein [bacterium]|nr:VTT domain-containing protein [bacterium]MCM1561527.1 VTT domain-containing protein [Butyrivibrio sp.]
MENQIDMKPSKHKRIQIFLKCLPFIVCVIFIILILVSGKEITVQSVLDYTPEDPLAAAFVILLLYALKSISFVFPIAVLQIATGHLFRTPIALLVNFLGRAITITIPYWVGRFSGSGMVDSLLKKYPKLQKAYSRQGQNPFFISFLLRTFCFLPGDAVSLYLGAMKIPFPYYLMGGILGTILGVVLATILGSSIREPDSPAFWLSALLMASMAVVSLILYIKNRKSSE